MDSKNRFNIPLQLFFLLCVPLAIGQNNTTYRDASLDSSRITVSFIIETSGEVTNVEVIKVECEGCKRKYVKSLKVEAIRVIKSMGKLDPVEKRTKAILPIKFSAD